MPNMAFTIGYTKRVVDAGRRIWVSESSSPSADLQVHGRQRLFFDTVETQHRGQQRSRAAIDGLNARGAGYVLPRARTTCERTATFARGGEAELLAGSAADPAWQVDDEAISAFTRKHRAPVTASARPIVDRCVGQRVGQHANRLHLLFE